MNNLLDLINKWANKLTYRILSISGASEQAKKNYLQAVEQKREDIIQADAELSGKVPVLRIIVYAGLFLVGFFVAKKLLNLKRR